MNVRSWDTTKYEYNERNDFSKTAAITAVSLTDAHFLALSAKYHKISKPSNV